MIPVNAATVGLAFAFLAQIGVWIWGIARMSSTLGHLSTAVRDLTRQVGRLDDRMDATERDVAVLKDRQRIEAGGP